MKNEDIHLNSLTSTHILTHIQIQVAAPPQHSSLLRRILLSKSLKVPFPPSLTRTHTRTTRSTKPNPPRSPVPNQHPRDRARGRDSERRRRRRRVSSRTQAGVGVHSFRFLVCVRWRRTFAVIIELLVLPWTDGGPVAVGEDGVHFGAGEPAGVCLCQCRCAGWCARRRGWR